MAIQKIQIYSDFLQKSVLNGHDHCAYMSINGFQAGAKLFVEQEFPFYMRHMNTMLKEQNFSKIKYCYVTTELLPISVSSIINPLFNNHLITNNPQPFFTFNVVSLKECSIVLVVWLDIYNDRMSWIKDKWRDDCITLINYLIFMETEDYITSVQFYNEVIKPKIKYILKCLYNRNGTTYFGIESVQQLVEVMVIE